MATAFPITVFGSTPGNIVVSCLLTVLTQRAQAVDYSEIIAVNSDAEFMIRMCGHGTFHFRRPSRFLSLKTNRILSGMREHGG